LKIPTTIQETIAVSVIICTWNRATLLRKTLNQFKALEIPDRLSWELLLVDNASTDNTLAVAEEFADVLPLRIVQELRPGKSYAANKAVELSRGEILLWTDDDALVDGKWIVSFLKAFERLQADIVYGKVEPWWETEPPAWYSNEFASRLALLDHGPNEMLMNSQGGSGYGVNYGFRRNVFEKIGPFRVDFGPTKKQGFGGEDTLFFEAAHERKLKVGYSPFILVRHFIPIERCNKTYHRRRAWISSEQYFRYLMERYQGLPSILRIPRFYIRIGLALIPTFLIALLSFDSKKRFFTEIQLIMFVGVLFRGIRNFCVECFGSGVQQQVKI